MKIHRKIKHFKWNIETKRHVRRVIYIFLRTARMILTYSNVNITIQPHGRSHTAVSVLLHKPCGDGAVNSAAHRYKCCFIYTVCYIPYDFIVIIHISISHFSLRSIARLPAFDYQCVLVIFSVCIKKCFFVISMEEFFFPK